MTLKRLSAVRVRVISASRYDERQFSLQTCNKSGRAGVLSLRSISPSDGHQLHAEHATRQRQNVDLRSPTFSHTRSISRTRSTIAYEATLRTHQHLAGPATAS